MEQGGLRIKGLKKQEMKGKPLVSVITAVFNGEKHLEKTIRSVINQTYENIEYIIIEGNSSDKTIEIIKKYEESIDYWVSEPDNGIYDAFNKGLKFSTGDYIGFLNSDDWYEADGIQIIMKNIKPYPAIYCGHMNLYSTNNKLLRPHISRPERLFQTMRVAHPTTFVAREIFDQIGFFTTAYKIAGDYDLLMRAKLKGFEIVVVDHIISNMLLGGVSKDLYNVFKEELIIKNKIIGNKSQHWIWYISNVILHFMASIIKTND